MHSFLILTHFTSIIQGCVEAWRTWALWEMVFNKAFSRLFTRVQGTGTLTALVDATAVVRAGIVRGTANGQALCARVALRAGGTVADGLVINALTHGLLATGLVVGATHWGTLPVPADVRGGAVVVSVTTYVVAANLWVAFVAWFACTERVVLYNLTVGIDTTLAWVFAEAIEASLV